MSENHPQIESVDAGEDFSQVSGSKVVLLPNGDSPDAAERWTKYIPECIRNYKISFNLVVPPAKNACRRKIWKFENKGYVQELWKSFCLKYVGFDESEFLCDEEREEYNLQMVSILLPPVKKHVSWSSFCLNLDCLNEIDVPAIFEAALFRPFEFSFFFRFRRKEIDTIKSL